MNEQIEQYIAYLKTQHFDAGLAAKIRTLILSLNKKYSVDHLKTSNRYIRFSFTKENTTYLFEGKGMDGVGLSKYYTVKIVLDQRLDSNWSFDSFIELVKSVQKVVGQRKSIELDEHNKQLFIYTKVE